jgi:hypothetical protein
VLVGFVQGSNRSRGFLSKGTRHKIESIGLRETKGVRCKTATSSSSDRTEGREGHPAGGSGGHGRRRSGRPRVRPRRGIGRVGQGEFEDVLNGVGGRRNRPEFAGQRKTRGSDELQQGSGGAGV